MFENIVRFFKKSNKREALNACSRETAKERLHLVLMQDRANVSADFLDLMRQEIIEVIKKYIDIDENAMDVRLTNQANEDGTQGAPALYANIPILSIKEKNQKKQKDSKIVKENETEVKEEVEEEKVEENNEEIKEKNKSLKSAKVEEKVEKSEEEKEDSIKENTEEKESSNE